MKRILGLALASALALTGLTACMGDDDGGSAAERRRSAALVNTSAGQNAQAELVITGLTPSGQAISVQSFSWGVANTGAAVQGESLSFTKTMDEASPLLLKGVAEGKPFTSAVLKLHTSFEDQLRNYATYELTNVSIANVQHGGHNEDVPTEQVTLKYSSLKETFNKFEGAAKTATTTYTFTNKG